MPTKIMKDLSLRSLVGAVLAALLVLALTACGGNSAGPSPYVASGTVTDSRGNPMEGVTIRRSGGWSDQTTNADGEWSAEVAGAVTVELAQSGWVSAPDAASVSVSTSEVDFEMTLSEELESDIAFVRDGDIYLLHADGSSTPSTGDDGGSDSSPDWSPDGSKIAFVSSRDGVSRSTHVTGSDGSGLIDLVGEDASSPAWSPSGSMLVFTDYGGPEPELFLMNSDGSGVRQLSFGGGEDADW